MTKPKHWIETGGAQSQAYVLPEPWIEGGGAQGQAYVLPQEQTYVLPESWNPAVREAQGQAYADHTLDSGNTGSIDTGSTVLPAPRSAVSGGSSGGGVTIEMPSYKPIPSPNLPRALDAETIARLSEEAKTYAQLAFAPGYTELDQNLVNAARRATEEEAAIKPIYWQNMRDATQMGATAAVRALQGANQLGRLRGGQAGEMYGNMTQAGMDQAYSLENQLGERVNDIYQNRTEVEEDIDRARVGMKKEEGLTEAVQRAQLMRSELEREISLVQMEFENRLASSADARDWQNVNLAYAQFKQNAEQAMWERDITERQLSAELQAQQFSNQITLANLSKADALTPYEADQSALAWARLAADNKYRQAEIDAMGNKEPKTALDYYLYDIALNEAKAEHSRIHGGNFSTGQLGWQGLTEDV
jgi:hypothetical protein